MLFVVHLSYASHGMLYYRYFMTTSKNIGEFVGMWKHKNIKKNIIALDTFSG